MTSSRSKNLENLGGICLFYEMPQWRDSAIVDLQRIIELRGAKAYLKLEAVGEEGMHIARIGPSASLEEMTPGYDTAAIAPALALDATQKVRDLELEILLAMARSPIAFVFPSIAELEAAVRIRRNTVYAAARAMLSFDPHGLGRPTDCWTYHPDTSFTLLPGVSLIDALRKTIHPDQSGQAYAFSCYRASEYVQLLGLAEDLKDHHPALLDMIEARWRRRAIMSEEFHRVFMRESGTIDEPLPARYYVPGDRVWFRNPDDASSDVYGYEGSWVFYLGDGRFNNFWDNAAPFTLTSKCLEVYHWRDGVYRDAQGTLCMDEDVVRDRVTKTRADPVAEAEILRKMLRARDHAGVYRDGGCVDATRESLRWVCALTSDMDFASFESGDVACAA